MLTTKGIQLGSEHAIQKIHETEKLKGRPLTENEKLEILKGWVSYFSIDWEAFELANNRYTKE